MILLVFWYILKVKIHKIANNFHQLQNVKYFHIKVLYLCEICRNYTKIKDILQQPLFQWYFGVRHCAPILQETCSISTKMSLQLIQILHKCVLLLKCNLGIWKINQYFLHLTTIIVIIPRMLKSYCDFARMGVGRNGFCTTWTSFFNLSDGANMAAKYKYVYTLMWGKYIGKA